MLRRQLQEALEVVERAFGVVGPFDVGSQEAGKVDDCATGLEDGLFSARVAAHKPRIACVPEGESIGIEEMLDGLAALPAADQRRPLKDGYAKVLARKFPCR